jgi:hypothetical protein
MIQGNKTGDGHQATVARRQIQVRPDIGIQRLLNKVREFGVKARAASRGRVKSTGFIVSSSYVLSLAIGCFKFG